MSKGSAVRDKPESQAAHFDCNAEGKEKVAMLTPTSGNLMMAMF